MSGIFVDKNQEKGTVTSSESAHSTMMCKVADGFF